MQSPWHEGEQRLQAMAGVAERMEVFGRKVIRDHMPDQHRAFFQQLPFLVAGTVDDHGVPWATLVEGVEGFASSPDPKHLIIDSALPADDPATAGISAGAAVGLLGIELHTRRRNRLNGRIADTADARWHVQVEQSFGNCPQYIQMREYRRVQEAAGPRRDARALTPQAIAMIEQADTFFVASYAIKQDGQRSVDVSHRGGRPGFVKVMGNRLLIPDYAGNLHFNTLGNLLVNPQAGLLFVDFTSGDVLQLTGHTELLLDSPLHDDFTGAERLWALDVQQVVCRPAAVSLRWTLGDYAPTTLATGTWAEAGLRQQERAWRRWRVQRIEQESVDIRSFYLQPEDDLPVSFIAGQHIPVRLTLPDGQTLIRTYSVSSAPSDGYVRISIKAQGLASRHLHEHLQVGGTLDVRLPIGGFTLTAPSPRPIVLIGAGVGITPLLAMLRQHLSGDQQRAIQLFQGARSLAELPFRAELDALERHAQGQLSIHRALSQPEPEAVPGRDYQFATRLGIEQIKATLMLDDYDFYLCGPSSFTQAIYDGLRNLNVPDMRIHAEAFGPSTLRRQGDVGQPTVVQPPAATQPAPVYFTRSAKEARWAPDSGTLLELAERRGLSPDFSCRAGSCGTCKTRLVSGQVHYPNLPAEMPEAGSVLICCAIPAQLQDGGQPLVLDI